MIAFRSPGPHAKSAAWSGGLAVGILGLLAGLVVSILEGDAADRADESAVIWRTLRPPPAAAAGEAAAGRIAQALLLSGAFGQMAVADTRAAAAAAGGGSDTLGEAPGKAPFPSILAAARIDNEAFVYLRQSNGSITGRSESAVLDEGWQILRISMNTVLAQHGEDPPETFAVFERPQQTPAQGKAGGN